MTANQSLWQTVRKPLWLVLTGVAAWAPSYLPEGYQTYALGAATAAITWSAVVPPLLFVTALGAVTAAIVPSAVAPPPLSVRSEREVALCNCCSSCMTSAGPASGWVKDICRAS